MPIVGLIGGVGSGKSSLARALAARRQIVVVDGDRAGHHVLTQPSVKDPIRARFSGDVFDEHGEIDRKALGREVFGSSPQHRRAKADLEAIVHPRIRQILEQEIAEAKQRSGIEAVLLDAAVLLEAGWRDLCDVVVFVDVPYPQRLARVQEKRGWDEGQLKVRESNQLPLQAKRESADYVIENSTTLDNAVADFERTLSHIKIHLP